MDQDNQDGDIKELLEENLELNKENHELLEGMARRAKWSFVFNVAKWVVIVGSALGLYYYFGQIFGDTLGMYRDLLWGNDTSVTASSTRSGLLNVEDKINNVLNSVRLQQ